MMRQNKIVWESEREGERVDDGDGDLSYLILLAHSGSEEVDVIDLSGCIALITFQHSCGSMGVLRTHLQHTHTHIYHAN